MRISKVRECTQIHMSGKNPYITMSIPTHISYAIGMTFRNVITKSIQSEPKACEFLRLRKGEHVTQDLTILNLIDLVNEGVLEAVSDTESDQDD
jgi:hypothetical protein